MGFASLPHDAPFFTVVFSIHPTLSRFYTEEAIMPEHTSSHLELEHIALADRDLFSLFLRYPEMPQPIDEPQDQIDVAPHTALLTTSSPVSSPSSKFYSSPLPNLTRYETPTSSPLGPPDSVPLPDLPVAVNEEEVEELTTKFDASVKSDDVPNNTGDLMAEMKSMIVFMGTMLFSGRTGLSTDLENLWRVKSAADWLIQSLRHAEGVIQGEINAIETILQLAPFTVRPTPEDLWTNYKQMAELIVQ